MLNNIKKINLSIILNKDFIEVHGEFEYIIKTIGNIGKYIIRLNERRLKRSRIFDEAKIISNECKKNGQLFILDEHIDIVRELDLDGVHISNPVEPLNKIRYIIGKDKIIGVSAKTLDDAMRFENAGADYIEVGPIFPTSTKIDKKMVSEIMLQKINKSIRIPLFAFGGISTGNVQRLIELGIKRITISSALLYSENIEKTLQFFQGRLK